MVKKSRDHPDFKYQKRSKENIRKRATQSGGSFDRMYNEGIETFSPKEGDFYLRILPPTWSDADHYGFELYVHYSVGVDDQTYLCPNKMNHDPCPVCEARIKAQDEGDTEYASKLSPKKRVAIWVIDRSEENEGPLLWSMPWSVDKEFAQLSQNKRTGEILLIDDPVDGYDIEFTKSGAGIKTKYTGIQIDRDPSELSDDHDLTNKWLDYATDHPIPDILNVYEYSHISNVFSGSSGKKEDYEDSDEKEDRVVDIKSRRHHPRDEEAKEEKEPRRRSRSRRDEEDKEDEKEEEPRRKRNTSNEDRIRDRLKNGDYDEEYEED